MSSRIGTGFRTILVDWRACLWHQTAINPTAKLVHTKSLLIKVACIINSLFICTQDPTRVTSEWAKGVVCLLD